MQRFLVVFRSHLEGPADVHYVGVTASSQLGAIAKAKREMPPLHPWVFAMATHWPRGCVGIDDAVKRHATATR